MVRERREAVKALLALEPDLRVVDVAMRLAIPSASASRHMLALRGADVSASSPARGARSTR